MVSQPPRRILVALEPIVLEGAFAALLHDGDRSEVVQFNRGGIDELAGSFDAAIVTFGFEHEVESDVLITLPDTENGGRDASVTIDGVTRYVSVHTDTQVIDLLTEQFAREIVGPRGVDSKELGVLDFHAPCDQAAGVAQAGPSICSEGRQASVE